MTILWMLLPVMGLAGCGVTGSIFYCDLIWSKDERFYSLDVVSFRKKYPRRIKSVPTIPVMPWLTKTKLLAKIGVKELTVYNTYHNRSINQPSILT